MKISSIAITNYRCFESATIEFGDELTVFVAENGNGKTSILDAVAIAFDRVVQHYTDKRSNAPGRVLLRREDIRMGAEAATVSVTTKGEKTLFEWSDSAKLLSESKSKVSRALHEGLTDYLDRHFRNETLDDLPLVVFYRADRNLRELADARTFKLRNFGAKHAFDLALDASVAFESIQHWFYQLENEELREKQKRRDFDFQDPRLKAVRTAIRMMLPEIADIGFDSAWEGLSASWVHGDYHGEKLLFTQLSDGFRNILTLTMDLAARLVMANPDRDEPLAAECIVMIDEIDLHLHPRWQQRIIIDLRRAFPGAQFILSTHSPQVLSTVRPENILLLRDGTLNGVHAQHSYGVQSNRILNEIMGVAARPDILELEEKKRAIMDAINLEDEEAFYRELTPLVKILGENDPFIINAKSKWIWNEKDKAE
jgi:predicted ATP-binding protein involved in virulence